MEDFRCNECGHEFDSSEAREKHFAGDSWFECPLCGNGDNEELIEQ